jgi:hypothetical protein|mmetsp:Transcript_81535/g.136497  ORF Transcript_81535/g.136497 Transcript_81535/m.136497 type:complete len:252 (+) Transcript_81535:586-1341(+)
MERINKRSSRNARTACALGNAETHTEPWWNLEPSKKYETWTIGKPNCHGNRWHGSESSLAPFLALAQKSPKLIGVVDSPACGMGPAQHIFVGQWVTPTKVTCSFFTHVVTHSQWLGKRGQKEAGGVKESKPVLLWRHSAKDLVRKQEARRPASGRPKSHRPPHYIWSPQPHPIELMGSEWVWGTNPIPSGEMFKRSHQRATQKQVPETPTIGSSRRNHLGVLSLEERKRNQIVEQGWHTSVCCQCSEARTP